METELITRSHITQMGFGELPVWQNLSVLEGSMLMESMKTLISSPCPLYLFHLAIPVLYPV